MIGRLIGDLTSFMAFIAIPLLGFGIAFLSLVHQNIPFDRLTVAKVIYRYELSILCTEISQIAQGPSSLSWDNGHQRLIKMIFPAAAPPMIFSITLGAMEDLIHGLSRHFWVCPYLVLKLKLTFPAFYAIVVNIIFLNILIAMFNNTVSWKLSIFRLLLQFYRSTIKFKNNRRSSGTSNHLVHKYINVLLYQSLCRIFAGISWLAFLSRPVQDHQSDLHILIDGL